MRTALWAFGILLTMAWVSSAQTLPTPPREEGQPTISSAAALIALHDAKSGQYNPNCLDSGCHKDIFNRVSLNSSIPPAHRLAAEMGIPATQCVFCHESTEIVLGISRSRGNAGRLGKNVDPESRCYPCHSKYGPAKRLYAR